MILDYFLEREKMSPPLFYDRLVVLKTLAARLTTLTIYLQALNSYEREAWLAPWKLLPSVILYENMDLVDLRIAFTLQKLTTISPRPWWYLYLGLQFPMGGAWVIDGLKVFINSIFKLTPSPYFALIAREATLMENVWDKTPSLGCCEQKWAVELSHHRSQSSSIATPRPLGWRSPSH